MIGLIGAGNNPMDGRKIKKRKRIQMNLKKKYGNYELHPQMKITGYENEILLTAFLRLWHSLRYQKSGPAAAHWPVPLLTTNYIRK